MAISRRNFLKTAAAATLAGTGGFYIHPDQEALAASNSPEVVKYTHCVMCNHGPKCGIKVIVKDDKVYRIEKRDNYPTQNLCAKGIASIQEIYEPRRLLHPMKRTTPKGAADPKWVQISWDEALKTIGEKFNDVKAKYGAEKVLFMTGDPKEPRSALQRLAFNFGSPNMGTESSTCYKATELATKLIYGTEWFTAQSIATGSGPTPGKTKVAIIWGNNFAWAHPFSFNGLKNGKDTNTVKYIVVDPRTVPVVHSFADVHLPVRPGTDGALALFFANMIIQEDKHDKEFIEKWSHGFDEYKEYVKQFTLEETAKICDIPAESLKAAARLLCDADGPITIKSAAAFPHHTNGVQNYRAMMLLIPLTGSFDVPGGFKVPDEQLPFDEWQGTFEFTGAGDLLPKMYDKRVDRDYFPVWAATDGEGSVQLNRIPEYVETGAIRACLMLGGNTMMWPQSQLYQQAFEKMEFVVAADFYIRPWTHDYVDIVLPAAMSFERAAPLTQFGRNLFLREPVVTPQGEARGDYRICADIGVALGMSDLFFGGGEGSEIALLREVLRTSGTGVTIEDLRKAHPNPVSVPLKGKSYDKKHELGLLRPDGQPGFTTPTGKVEFTSEILRDYGFDPLPTYKEPVYSPISTPEIYKDYPLVLMTGCRVPYYTHSKERELPWLNQFMPEPVININPVDAAARDIKNGDMIELATPVGKIQAKANITNILRPGHIDMFHGWKDANINLVIARDFDPISGFPPYKEGLCQVKKV